MDKLNEWAKINLGDWAVNYSALYLFVAVALALILLLTIIIVTVRHIKVKQKIKKLKADLIVAQTTDHVDDSELRASIENELRAEYDAIYAERSANQEASSEEIDTINRQLQLALLKVSNLESELSHKNLTIDELKAKLEQAKTAPAKNDKTASTKNNDTNDNEIKKLQTTIDELNRQIDELRSDSNARLAKQNDEFTARIRNNEDEIVRKIAEKDNQINLLLAENAQIKLQLQQQRQRSERTETAATETAATRQSATSARPTSTRTTDQAQSAVDNTTDDDEYDEYYDDYGDDSSAVKVTLKFDRIKNSWVIMRSDINRTYRRLATKQEALVIAKDLARRLHAQLIVHKKDGRFQKI